MKLRIRGDSLRLRLGQAEVATLAESGVVEETTSFGPGPELAYALKFGPVLGATLVGTRIEITIPADVARVWATSEAVGVEGTQHAAGGRLLRILVEKDWACVKPREGEDDADSFPHP